MKNPTQTLHPRELNLVAKSRPKGSPKLEEPANIGLF
jgi:hypothetical protein